METWKKIKNFENYEISDLGVVRSYHKINPKILKIKFTKKGYNRVTLQENGIKKTFLIHRLVAIHFLENKENKDEVNHIDCDKNNNKLSNLEWVTKSENMKHSYFNGRNKKSKKVIREDGKIYNSIVEASIDNNVTTTAINNCINNRSKKSNGYVFKYF